MRPFENAQVEDAYNSVPDAQREVMLNFRELILDTAETIPSVGKVTEGLKWNQPSFSTKTGSPIRVDKVRNSEDVAVYFICTTKLVDQFKEQYPDQFKYEGSRALIFDINAEVPKEELSHCIAMALTYKLNS